MPLSAIALCLRKESNDIEDSKAFSDVSEDHRTPSTVGSDDRHAGSDSSDVDDSCPDSGSGVRQLSSSIADESSCDEEVSWQGSHCPDPSEPEDLSVNKIMHWTHAVVNKQVGDCDGEEALSCAETDADDSPFLSSRSDQACAEDAATASEEEAQEPEPEFANILRWDADRGAWLPEEIRITEAPTLKPFQTAISFMDDIPAESSSKASLQDFYSRSSKNKSFTANEVFNLFKTLNLDNTTEKQASSTPPRAPNVAAVPFPKALRGAAVPFTPALSGAAAPFTPQAVKAAGTSFSTTSRAFVPAGQAAADKAEKPAAAAEGGTLVSIAEALAASKRTRLKSSAASFVPFSW